MQTVYTIEKKVMICFDVFLSILSPVGKLIRVVSVRPHLYLRTKWGGRPISLACALTMWNIWLVNCMNLFRKSQSTAVSKEIRAGKKKHILRLRNGHDSSQHKTSITS